MNRVVVLVLALAACNRARPYEDIGKACLGQPAPFGTDTGSSLGIGDGDPVPVTVVLSECTSGSVEWLDQACAATADGDQIVVEAVGATKVPNYQTSDCRWVEQDCGTVTLGAGDWTLVYGAGEASFTVPYDGSPICAVNDVRPGSG